MRFAVVGVAVALLLAPRVPRAQQPLAFGRYRLDVWTAENGLPGNGVIGPLVRSPDGYLWFLTLAGLVRFDGAQFTLFTGDNMPVFRGRVGLRPLLVDRTGKMWIATSRGLVWYRNGEFHDDGPRYSAIILSIAEDASGTLWLHSARGQVFRVARDRQGARLVEVTPAGIPEGSVTALVSDARGTLWMGSDGGGLVRLEGAASPRPRMRRFTTRDGLASNGVLSVSMLPDGSLWIGSGAAATRLENGVFRVLRIPGVPHTSYVTHAVGDGGVVWLATYGAGLYRYDARTGRLAALRRTDGLADDEVEQLYEDAEGGVWAGSQHGLTRLRPVPFTSAVARDGETSNPAAAPGCLHRDHSGRIWHAPASGGLYRYRSDDPGGPADQVEPPSAGKLSWIASARDGGLWLARYDGTLTRLRAAGSRPRVTMFRMPSAMAFSVVEDTSGTVWVGTLNGLVRKRGAHDTLLTERDGLPARNVHGLAPGQDGALWVTTDEGVARIMSDAIRAYGTVRGPPEAPTLRGIRTVFRDRTGTLWLGTWDGITRVTEGPAGPSFATVRTRHGLPENTASAIQDDALGNLWIVANSGITRVPLAELNAVADGRKATLGEVATFGIADGLPTSDGTVGNCAAAAEDVRGRLWFAMARGIAVVDPARMPRSTLPPVLHIAGATVDGMARPVGRALTVPAGARRLEVQYTGVDLRAGPRVRFWYRLDGFDPDWVAAGTARAASYTRLAPGSYRFRLRARSSDGVWSAREATLDLRVLPPFYQTWWFLTAAAASLVGVLWTAYRLRAGAMQARFAAVLGERERVARELHDTLLGGMTGIAMRLDVAATRAASPHGLDPSTLGEVRDLAYSTLTDARRSVWDLRTLAAGTADLGALLDDAARRVFADTTVDVRVEHVGRPRPYAPVVEAQVFRIVSEALTNARKHGDCRTVVVTCTHQRRELRVRVRDDGRGFVADGGTAPGGHWGLLGMRERAVAIGGALSIESAPGAGTTVTLVVPRAAEGHAAGRPSGGVPAELAVLPGARDEVRR
jgi:signal transduction histidine kinase/ligand-binding sensor domain-containing protein